LISTGFIARSSSVWIRASNICSGEGKADAAEVNGVEVRTARPEEAQALSELAMRAKASWGYDAAFMAACRDELTLTPQKLAAWRVWVAETGGRLAGMIALSEGDVAEVEDFFVEPVFQGRGVGRALMDVLICAARSARLETLEVDADPNAEHVYARLGFETVGRSPSGSIPGRWLPRMRLVLSPHTKWEGRGLGEGRR
jgi:GNAT superfamily N-acetyltransferase